MFVHETSRMQHVPANKRFLLLFVACCSLPFIAAKLALSFEWFSAGVTNKGQWLVSEVQLLNTLPDAREHWHLVYVQTPECGVQCELSLYGLQQIHESLGRQGDLLNTVIIAPDLPKQLRQFPTIKWRSPVQTSADLQGHIFIVNRQGFALLTYPIIRDKQNLLSVGKDVRTDLRKLMNYDRGSM